MIREDIRGYMSLGQSYPLPLGPFDCVIQSPMRPRVIFAVVTYHREYVNSVTARDTAALTDLAWNLPRGTTGVWLAYDAKHASHFPEPVKGYLGLNRAIAERIMPLFENAVSNSVCWLQWQNKQRKKTTNPMGRAMVQGKIEYVGPALFLHACHCFSQGCN